MIQSYNIRFDKQKIINLNTHTETSYTIMFLYSDKAFIIVYVIISFFNDVLV